MNVRKGIYRERLETETGDKYTSERGFTFETETGRPMSFDVHEHETGMALLFGDQIFFLGFWSDENLEKASKVFAEAIEKEQARRKRITDDT